MWREKPLRRSIADQRPIVMENEHISVLLKVSRRRSELINGEGDDKPGVDEERTMWFGITQPNPMR